MNQIRIIFEKGGVLLADLNNRAPKTVNSFLNVLPWETRIFHTRWCGREISFGIKTNEDPPQENCSNIVSKFDVAYWRDWERGGSLKEAPGEEAIAIYYGPELLRYHNGLIRVNVIGRIKWEQEELLEEIGIRIWQQGVEQVKVERC